MYIAIAGNIGSGKTTLTNMLAKHYGWKKFLEPVDDNPYIDDYYKDISRWALNLVFPDTALQKPVGDRKEQGDHHTGQDHL